MRKDQHNYLTDPFIKNYMCRISQNQKTVWKIYAFSIIKVHVAQGGTRHMALCVSVVIINFLH